MNRPNDPARQHKRFGGESVPTPRVGSRYAASIRVGCVPQSRRYCVMTRALLAIALTAALTGCAVADVARYQAVLDDFAVPDGWELALTKSVTPDTTPNCGGLFGDCPRAYRYYLAPGAGADIYAAAKAMVTNAGFELDQEIRPTCDGDPPRTPACGIIASRDSDLLQVSVFNAGEDPDDVGVAANDRMQVRLIAKPK